jgi:hypothetical protein
MWSLGQRTLLGIVVGYVAPRATHIIALYWVLLLCYVGLGQHTLLGIGVGYVAPRVTHITGYCCWFMRGL